YAIYSGDLDVMTVLLDAGADANTADNYSTALGTAVTYGEYKGALLLMDHGADPTLTGDDGLSAMDLLGAEKEEEFLKMLEEGV
ncbi:MAG: ankyrin repeat domain-containing protein, partial [Solibacillus sp.]